MVRQNDRKVWTQHKARAHKKKKQEMQE